MKGLRRLEYRGYDSAGIAFLQKDHFEIQKAEGKLANVEKLVSGIQVPGLQTGIGHTRWATHGKPTTQNAHPHRTGSVVLVHNGIIENYLAIKDELIKKGHHPLSETDSELFGFLVLDEMREEKDFPEAVRKAFLRVEGSCSVVVVCDSAPGVVVGIRNGPPLVVAKDPEGGMILASDAQPLVDYTRDVVFLENGDFVIARSDGMEVKSFATGKPVERKASRLDWSADKLDRGGYAHYMLKEIYEQPRALVDTLNGILDRARAEPFPFQAQPGVGILAKARSFTIVACGTSWHAAQLGKYWIERFAGIPVEVELASEYRYRTPVRRDGQVVIAMTQSGETADTLAVVRDVRSRGIPVLGITNVRGSTVTRDADAVFYTSAGPEIGVAATKTFLTQMLTLLLFAGKLGIDRGGAPAETAARMFEETLRLPHSLEDFLSGKSSFAAVTKKVAASVADSKGFFFIGRGTSFPIALEGALKLKEIAYVHAEGYAAGELKHGPIAMLDSSMTVVVLAPQDSWREKTISNLQEVKARKARVLGVGAETDTVLKSLCDEWIGIDAKPDVDEALLPFWLAPVMQLLSYELALLRGTDVDQPRNLAKSVTVE